MGLLVWGVVAGVGAVAGEVEATRFDWVDPRRLAIETDASFVDPRWERALTERLERCRPFRADDVDGLAEISQALFELPFVAEVGPPRLVWPDGAVVDVRFERPVACLRRGATFLCVSAQGRVLPGGWAAPPTLDGLTLPVLGRLGQDEADAVPGQPLARAGLWHGLSLVLSLEEHLDRDERLALGTLTIDAENGALAQVEDPGAVLHLEGRRAVLWGRTPDVDAPGALPTELKWRHVVEAVELSNAQKLLWRAVDVRWDEYAVALRHDEPVPEPEVWRSALERTSDEDAQRRADGTGLGVGSRGVGAGSGSVGGGSVGGGSSGGGSVLGGNWEPPPSSWDAPSDVNRGARPTLGRVR
jgi:uncharacterized membrane protein YgcG